MSTSAMKYVSANDVLVRLQGKLRITDDEEEAEEGRMTRALFNRLVAEAEAQVEYDLSERYASPFAADGGAYSTLPDSPTRSTIRRMVAILACVYVLETDFGSGTIVEGAKYREQLQKQYDRMIDHALEKRDVGGDSAQWLRPPLPGLMLSASNMAGDDGFRGTILVTSQNDGDFPQKQINDPSETLFGGRIDR